MRENTILKGLYSYVAIKTATGTQIMARIVDESMEVAAFALATGVNIRDTSEVFGSKTFVTGSAEVPPSPGLRNDRYLCPIYFRPEHMLIWRAMRFVAVQATENTIGIRRWIRVGRVGVFLISFIAYISPRLSGFSMNIAVSTPIDISMTVQAKTYRVKKV